MGACHSSSDHHPRHKHPPSDGRPNLNSLDNHTSTKVSSHSSMPESNPNANGQSFVKNSGN
jgi:hypothetical protein